MDWVITREIWRNKSANQTMDADAGGVLAYPTRRGSSPMGWLSGNQSGRAA